MINHSNAGIIITDGDKIYDKALYIISDEDLEKSDYVSFSKPLTNKKQILIQFHTVEASFLAIGIEERKQLAKWLLEGLE
jgi:hypothetical protein